VLQNFQYFFVSFLSPRFVDNLSSPKLTESTFQDWEHLANFKLKSVELTGAAEEVVKFKHSPETKEMHGIQ
jgi:hypothetical protein